MSYNHCDVCKRLRNNVSNWKSAGLRQLSVDNNKALLLYLQDDCPFITYIIITITAQ